VIASAVIVAYAPALRAPFDFDDVPAIVDNPTIRTLWPPAGPLHTPQRGTSVSGRPVANYSLALNYAANAVLGIDQRPDPNGPSKTVGYHALNILLHLMCGVLLFGVLLRTLRSPGLAARWGDSSEALAAIVTAIWLLHPIPSEAVNYVVQRTELLVSACYLGTLYAAIRAGDSTSAGTRRMWYAIAVLVCLLGMGTKEVMLTAPLMVVLYDRAFRWSSWRDILRGGRGPFYLALAATSAWSLTLIFGGARAESVGFHGTITWHQYLYSQGWAIAHYLRLSIWPDALLHDYGMTPVAGLQGVPGLVILGAVGTATVVAWARPERWGWFGFLGAWFFLLLAPSSSVVPIQTEIAAERRIYLALAAVLVFVVFAVEGMLRRVTGGTISRLRRVVIVTLGALGILLTAATFHRSRAYADPVAMWREVVQRTPRNARGYSGLGIALLRRDTTRLRDVESLVRQAIALDSAFIPSWNNLAQVLMMEGRLTEARQALDRALLIEPNNFDAQDRLGRLLAVLGESARAIPYLERSVAYQPTDVDARVLLGVAYVGTERWDDAIRTLRQALGVDPERTDAMRYLGRALAETDRAADAVTYLEEATKREPRSALGFATLSLADAELSRVPESVAAAATAVAHAGDGVEVFILAGRAMLTLHRAADAERYFSEAVRLGPNDPQSITGLGIAEADLGRHDHAIQLLRRALALQPDYMPARQALDLLAKSSQP
jgi:Flp pilus assembly protein TadD